MDLKEHCEAYLSQAAASYSVFNDTGDDFLVDWNLPEWSKNTSKGLNTLYDLGMDAYKSSLIADTARYIAAVEEHQKYAIDLAVAYVKYYLRPWEGTGKPEETIEQKRYNSRIAFIAEKGWKWFKFCDFSVHANLTVGDKKVKYQLIPRYNERFMSKLTGGLYLDADEVSFVKNELDSSLFDQIMDFKSRSAPYKIYKNSSGTLSAKAVNTFNTTRTIRDWTLKLFPY